MKGQVYGYVKVSPKEKFWDRQIAELREYEIPEECITVDRVDGRTVERPGIQELLRRVQAGDEVYFQTLYSIGSTKEDIRKTIMAFYRKGVTIRILDIPTTLMAYPQFGEMEKTVWDILHVLVLELLSVETQQEKRYRRRRQSEGIAAAFSRNTRLGRPPEEITEAFISAWSEWRQGEITAKEAMARCNLKKTTFYKLVKQYESERGTNLFAVK